MKRLLMGAMTITLGAVIAACGTTAPSTSTGAGTSATSTGASTSATSAGSMSATTTGMESATTTGSMSATTTGMESATSTGSMSATTTGMESATTTGMESATSTGSMSATTTSDTGAMTGTAMAGAGSIVDVATSQGSFTTLLTALKLTGLDKQLAQAGEYTVFAPTDAAFAALPPATLQALIANPAQLQKILSYHVAQGALKATDVTAATSIPTLEGQSIKVTVSGSTVTLNDSAKVTQTDIQTTNGIIHVIDQVLVPSDVTLP